MMAKNPNSTEDQVQAAVAEHLRFFVAKGVVWTHVPNGGMRSKAVAGRLRQHGVRAGWPDILLVAMGRVYALELKTTTGTTSKEQEACLSDRSSRRRSRSRRRARRRRSARAAQQLGIARTQGGEGAARHPQQQARSASPQQHRSA